MKRARKSKMIFCVALLLTFGFVASVQAGPISLQNGPVFIQFNNLEQVDTSLQNSIDVPGTVDYGTAGNWGLFNVSSIQAGGVATPNQDISGGPAYFLDDGPDDFFGQGQITGIFYGVNLTSGTTATGGTMDLYWFDADEDFVTADDLNGLGATPTDATVDQWTSGEFLVRLNLAPGIIPGDATTTLQSDIDLTVQTTNGKAELFADVDLIAGGAWATVLDTNWFYVDVDGDGIFGEDGERRDVRLATFFNGLANWDDPDNEFIKGLRSNDPGRAYAVPEPSTFVLLGVGLLGMFGLARRRNSK